MEARARIHRCLPYPEMYHITGGEQKLLSRDCDGCSQMKACSRRYGVVDKGHRVYCPDGTAHLVDGL